MTPSQRSSIFVAIRDLLVMISGTWSANEVLETAQFMGLRGRRQELLQAIKTACGKGSRNRGPRVEEFGSHLVPGTKLNLVPAKEKKEAKKRKYIYTPELLRNSTPQDFGALSADVELYLANAAAENKTGTLTASRVASECRALAALRDEIGEANFARGLRVANRAGAANINYVKKAGIGSRGGAQKQNEFGSGAAQIPFLLRPENGASDYAAVLEGRAKKTGSEDA